MIFWKGKSAQGKTSFRGFGVCLFLALFVAAAAFAEEDTRQILFHADQARGNLEGVSWNVEVTSVQGDRTTEIGYHVDARNFDFRAENTSPPKFKGNRLLMTDGNMWFYKPGLSKPVPISRRQKLLGNAAYGDIASTNYADDYTATPLPEETVDNEACYVFDLKAKTAKATYDAIKYWISKERLVGIKAFYFTVSGKIVKSSRMEYNNRMSIEGKMRPFISKITIYDELMTKDVTTMDLKDPKFEALPDHIFNLNMFTQ
jgi:outer membrane lipoprotein-sorting protein